MPPEPWALQRRQRERGLRSLLFFNQTRKSTLLIRPRTVASANRTRFLIFLQMPIENAQELAKEEGEESEAKLKAAIMTSEGAIPAVAGKWWDTWRWLLRSTDIIWWARVRFRAASVGGNQFRCSHLLLLITTYAKRTGLGATEPKLWTHHHHQPSSFY